MLLRRIIGAETEFSVALDAPHSRHNDAAAAYLVNQYGSRRSWPGFGSCRYTGNANLSTNLGSRFYLDVGSHPEFCDPETTDPWQATLYGKVSERVLTQAGAECSLSRPEYAGLKVFKNNTAGGNSWAWHLNLLAERKTDIGVYIDAFMPFLVSAQVVNGTGCVVRGTDYAKFALSQRSLHFWETVGSGTTRSRPIFNTRDEPLADEDYWRRLHLIPLDSNLSEVATFLTIGMAVLVAEMAECGCAPGLRWSVDQPVQAMRQICLDPTLKGEVPTSAGKKSGLQILVEHHQAAKRHLEKHRRQTEDWHLRFLPLNEAVLNGLAADPLGQRSRVLWALKLHTLQLKAPDLGPQAEMYDLVLNRLWPIGAYQKLSEAGKVERLFDKWEIKRAFDTPPPGRPYARSTLRQAYPGFVGFDWENIRLWYFEKNSRLLRTQMRNPFGPSADEVDELASLGLHSLVAGRRSQPAA